MKKLLIPLVVITFLVQSCGSDKMGNDQKGIEKYSNKLDSHKQALVSNANAFSYDLFHRLVRVDSTKNVFISPLSISMALGMVLNGAAGTTKAGILKTLGMSELTLHEINQSYQNLMHQLVNLDPTVNVNIANSLWGRKGLPIKQNFINTLQTYYSAHVEKLDFGDPASVNKINSWVSEQTNGRINKIISGKIPPRMMLYLVNAIYFKGTWHYKFDPKATQPAPFYLGNGSTVEVAMMHRQAPLATYISDTVRMAQLAYGDSSFVMDILMPANPDIPIDRFIQNSLTGANVNKWISQLSSEKKKKIALPKFEISYKKSLNEVLKAMGMEEAFNKSKANFSKISPKNGLYISKVLHKANITVNEEGSEAAAVTSVGMKTLAFHKGFQVNRPFVYIIRERTSGAILFIGVMRNPLG